MIPCYQWAELREKQLEQQFPQYARSTFCTHVKMPVNDITLFSKPKRNTGRLEKLNSKDKGIVLHMMAGHSPSKHVHLENSLKHLSNPTICCHIKKLGFYYLHSRKKDVLYVKDLILRRKFCPKITCRTLGQEFWRHCIGML